MTAVTPPDPSASSRARLPRAPGTAPRGRRRCPGGALRLTLLALAILASAPAAPALDEVVLGNGRRYLGTIVASTADSIVLSIDGGTVEFPRSAVVSPRYEGPPSTRTDDSGVPVATRPHPLPDVTRALRDLRAFSWASQVRQVPALVVDRGRWQFLPCLSFWAGDFLLLNVYGDPARPAAIEVSLLRPPAEAWEQKRHALEYMLGLAPGLAVDSRFDKLNIRGDSFAAGDLWFAVSGPESADTPGRWAVLLLYELSLTPSRASSQELEAISEPVPVAVLDPTQPRSWQRGSWTPADLEWLHDTLALAEPQPRGDAVAPGAQSWGALGGERVFVRAFVRERGRYQRSSADWLRGIAAVGSP